MPRKKKEETITVVEEKKSYAEVFDYLSSIYNDDDYLNKASAYFKENKLIRDFIPYQILRNVANEIVQESCYKDGKFVKDSLMLRVLACSTEMILYLDVKWPEDIDYIANYDLYRIFNVEALLNVNIDHDCKLMNMCNLIIEDINVNELSIVAQVKEFLSNAENDIAEQANNPEFIRLLANQITNQEQ